MPQNTHEKIQISLGHSDKFSVQGIAEGVEDGEGNVRCGTMLITSLLSLSWEQAEAALEKRYVATC